MWTTDEMEKLPLVRYTDCAKVTEWRVICANILGRRNTTRQFEPQTSWSVSQQQSKKIYDRLEDYLQQRQQVDASEMKAIKKALRLLGNAQHDAAAAKCSFA